MTSHETIEAKSGQVIQVDFRSDKRRNEKRKAAAASPNEAFAAAALAQPVPIRAIDALYLRNKMVDISGWWLRLTLVLTMVAIGYFIAG